MFVSIVYLSCFLSLFNGALSRPQAIPIPTNSTPVDIRNSVCGDIIVAKEQGYRVFWALDAFECLSNVPFIDAVATRFLNYYNQTLQFQSTLAYLKSPPEGYQQPPVDVLKELQSIQDKINSGAYTNQYTFEAEVQLLINRMHDGHVWLNAGAMSPFRFVSPYGLVSASPDGKQPPAIYLQSDVVESQREGWTPSPITKINDQDVVDYLTAFAELNSEGYVEPHADWNALFDHPARDIQGGPSVLQSATFYPGDELNFTFANDSDPIETYWLATFHESQSTGPLTTAGDFYNYFVLGLLPESYDEENPKWWPDEEGEDSGGSQDTEDTSEEPAETEPGYGCSGDNPSWCSESSGAYPDDPDIVQKDLEVIKGGIVTGYILDDISTGVLSIPSFYQTGDDTVEFFNAVDDFIATATQQNIKKVVIDLQQNSGGLTFLALSTFKRFFYAQEPYTGSRIRSHELANILGTTYSEWWDGVEVGEAGAENELYQYFASSEWVATNRINAATGDNFSSWKEYYGPIAERGDTFSRTQLYNLSDEVFAGSAFQGLDPYGYGDSANPPENLQPWAPEDIVLLTDGLCNSVCAYFVELMTHQAGVRSVVVGGRPTTGPMQTASGNRGARVYDAESLDYDFLEVKDTMEDAEAAARLPERDDRGMWINSAGFNIRDKVREEDEGSERIPLQFRYEAADCRIYYTLKNVYNMTRLWRDAAAAAWTDPSLCVEDSTGYAPKRNTSVKPPPQRNSQAPLVDFTTLGKAEIVDLNINLTTEHLNLKERISLSSKDIPQCPARNEGTCGTGTCRQVPLTVAVRCPNGVQRYLDACLPPCSNYQRCPGTMQCIPYHPSESKGNVPAKSGRNSPAGYDPDFYDGYCEPIDPVNPKRYRSGGCPL